MNNKCIYFKVRTKTINNKKNVYYYCANQRKIIQYSNCKNCHFKEFKEVKRTVYPKTLCKSTIKRTSLHNKSTKLSKLEKNRSSLFTDNLDECMFCTSTNYLTWHEIYSGSNRQNSMKYKLCLRMCLFCHEKYQENKLFNEKWHKKGQVMFNKTYPDLKFEDIFKKNYL